VLWLVLRQTPALGGAGLARGDSAGIRQQEVHREELFGLEGSDPSAIGAAVALLAAVRWGPGRGPRGARAGSIR
jgi:hypothetical protein